MTRNILPNTTAIRTSPRSRSLTCENQLEVLGVAKDSRGGDGLFFHEGETVGPVN
jgi:hypothetical protein